MVATTVITAFENLDFAKCSAMPLPIKEKVQVP